MGYAYDFASIRDNIDSMKTTKFLSVNDCFWVKTSDKQNWSDVNLFSNSFTKAIGEICLLGKSDCKTSEIYSPHFINGVV